MDRQARKLNTPGKEGENGSENGSELGSNTDSENEEKVRTDAAVFACSQPSFFVVPLFCIGDEDKLHACNVSTR